MKATRLGWAVLALLGTELLAVPAGAQTAGAGPVVEPPAAERASARAIADQGFDAFDAGEWRVALDRFERAESLVHSPVHRLFIARCQANLGLLLEAKETYLGITRERLAADAVASLEAQRAAGAELAALEGRIPFVLVSVKAGSGTVEPISVSMDGKRVPSALVGVPYPVNPGRHTWRAQAGSSTSSTEERLIRESSRETVSLTVDAAPASPASKRLPAPAPAAEPDDGWPWAAIASFGVGAAGVGVGTAFALKKSSLDAEIERTCRADGCPGTEQNLEREDDANAAGLVATIAFIGAGAGIATGVTLLLLDRGEQADDRRPSASVSPWLGLGSAGLRGRF
jgi:hypothetical protein